MWICSWHHFQHKQGNQRWQTPPPTNVQFKDTIRQPVTTINAKYAPLWENMMLSAKPEVCNALHATVIRAGLSHGWFYMSNMYRKFCEIWTYVFEICERTDRHTDTLIAILPTSDGVK